MPINILLPALSPTMTTGNLVKWYKKEGDVIKAGQILAEVETDKAIMEIEAVDNGKLAKILVVENTMNVPVNSVIAVLVEDDEDMAIVASFIANLNSAESKIDEHVVQKVSDAKVSEEKILNEKPSDGKIFISPLAKRLANQRNIDITTIQGSGPNGRIIKSDIEKYVDKPILDKSSASSTRFVADANFSIEPHTGMRKVIASRLLESKQTIPHFYLTIDCKMDNLIALREQLNVGAENKVSINDFIIKAVALTMRQMPYINSSWSVDGIKKYTTVDVSVAVSVDNGLVTPIINDADLKTLSNISMQMKDLAKRARENKLKPEEFQGGGFTISNLGMFGIKSFSAIINPPQSCILAVGATIKKPIVIEDKIEIVSIMETTLSCDHRVVDGVLGANFLKSFKDYLENPIKMLI